LEDANEYWAFIGLRDADENWFLCANVNTRIW
jgi:hypothetical protein